MLKQGQASTPWHKSTYSSGAHNCVEVSEGPTTGVRDTKHRELGALFFSGGEWESFLNLAKRDLG
ncbi:DUF397 domain-containing protein [Nocardiopsis sp. NPDC006832]|uniref:DUF397 domain-containing protein n=1 Tax=Nocardiopsis sp. NPDC006832 TaxID=3157188 RepID=UPI00340DECF3